MFIHGLSGSGFRSQMQDEVYSFERCLPILPAGNRTFDEPDFFPDVLVQRRCRFGGLSMNLRRQIVENHNLMSLRNKFECSIGADEAGSAGDEYF